MSAHGKCSIISDSTPFALKLSKGERWVFLPPARYSFFRLAVLHLSGIVLLVITVSVVLPFFLDVRMRDGPMNVVVT
jgi:hypothetical protein